MRQLHATTVVNMSKEVQTITLVIFESLSLFVLVLKGEHNKESQKCSKFFHLVMQT